MLPDEVADGEATVRVGRSEAGVDRLSPPVTFAITSDPLPLDTLAVPLMTPVAPGQWTDLVKDHVTDFEVRRADRIEIEFRQGDVALIGRALGPDSVHVQVPGRLAPGLVTVRTRTWIEQVASEWSIPDLLPGARTPGAAIGHGDTGGADSKSGVVVRKCRACLRRRAVGGGIGAAGALPRRPGGQSARSAQGTTRDPRSVGHGCRRRRANRNTGASDTRRLATCDWRDRRSGGAVGNHDSPRDVTTCMRQHGI